MSVSQSHSRATLLAFLAERVRRDLQFSNIFLVDACASLVYAAATLFLVGSGLTPRGVLILAGCGLIYLALHAAKIWLVVHLERQGGDAREFVGSDTLVTSGFYAFSRNPVYLVTLVQSFVWSLGLAASAADGAAAGVAAAFAPLLLYGHFWGMDRLIIPNEEAALRRKHPEAFAAYCARVRRWFGRRGQAGTVSL